MGVDGVQIMVIINRIGEVYRTMDVVDGVQIMVIINTYHLTFITYFTANLHKKNEIMKLMGLNVGCWVMNVEC